MKKIAFVLAALVAAVAIGSFGCDQPEEGLDVYVPDGAPALALALPMYEDTKDDGVEYHVVSSTLIQTYVTGKDPDAEVCVLPVNAAAKLLGNGERYRMAGVLTHGNVYLLAQHDVQYTKENLSSLTGKTVGVVQLNNVPGLTFKACLAALGIPCNDLSGGATVSETAVNVKAADPKVLDGADVYLVPSPAADRRAGVGEWRFVGDLQQLYGDGNGYPQAVLVVKNEVVSQRGEWLQALLARIEANTAWLQSAEKATIAGAVQAHLAAGLMPTFTKDTLTDGAILHSGIRLQRMDRGAVAAIEDFLQRLIAIDPSKAAIPEEKFYLLNT